MVKLAYSCVVDAKPKFEWQAFLWAHSVLRNVGCRPDDLKIHCLPGVSEYFRRSMGNLNIHIVDTEPFGSGHVYCNKIQQCFSGVFGEYDKVILTDADLFFLAPPQLPSDKPFAGKIVELQNPPLEMLRAIYREAGIEPSEAVPVGCALSAGEMTITSNLNGGFYAIDRALLEELGRHWRKHALWVYDRIERLGAHQAHVDQIAMALALDELGIDFSLLTAQSNFPVHLPKERLSVLVVPRIDVLHYHASVLPNGQIKDTGVPFVDGAIARANSDIQTIIGDNFDNALFWNNRYASFPELGSGIGSRGEVLQYKKERLGSIVRSFKDKTVLEVGCGDLETSKDLPFTSYVGYDMSAAALEIAKKKRPDWRFEKGTIGDPRDLHQADLVICLDVLIHQKREEGYRTLIASLVRAARQRLIVSGYETRPSFESNIVAFHESLSATLRDCGAFNEIMAVGNYRDVSLIVADKRPTGPARHENDLPVDIFNDVALLVERPDLLCAAMDCSREHLGFFTKTSSRAMEYPWVLEKLAALAPGASVLDIGAGVSPLPIMLAERGLRVNTVDSHPLVRTADTRDSWNEWGFLDYGQLLPGAASFHVDVLQFRAQSRFDAIYSVSVIEHMPRPVWERTLELMASWLTQGGLLLLTLDLIPGTDALWNMSEGKPVDQGAGHGCLEDVASKLRGYGLVIEDLFVKRKIPHSRTDVAFLKGRRVNPGRAASKRRWIPWFFKG